MTDYISREAAYSIAKKVVDAIANGEYHAGVFAYDIMDWIDELPAADVRPVRRGKWKHDGFSWFCNRCNYNALCDKDTGEEVLSPRCPNCGAMMEES